MIARKTRLLFVALTVLSLGTLSGSVFALCVVPDINCPGAPVPPHSCWVTVPYNQSPWLCFRRDSDIEEISAGTESTLENDYVKFENCDGCPESTPSSKSFSKTLSVPFTEVVTVMVPPYGIGFWSVDDEKEVTAKLNESIGHSAERTAPASVRNVLCSTSVAGCEIREFIAVLKVKMGIETRITHEFSWHFEVTHNPMPMTPWYAKCKNCQKYPSNPWPGNTFPMLTKSKQKTNYSTAIGSSYNSSAVCEEWPIYSCDGSW